MKHNKRNISSKDYSSVESYFRVVFGVGTITFTEDVLDNPRELYLTSEDVKNYGINFSPIIYEPRKEGNYIRSIVVNLNISNRLKPKEV